jgi:hypothetical protein
MGKLKITHTSGGQIRDAKISPTLVGGANVGGTGGLTSQTGNQIKVRCKIGSNANADASILGQKGIRKFRVQDSAGNKGACKLVNKANGSLLAGEMNIVITKIDASTVFASRITNKFVYDFSGNRYRYHLAAQATPFVQVAYA